MKRLWVARFLIFALFFLPASFSFDQHLFDNLNNPQVKAFLDVISYAEGTLKPNGYRLRYPNVFFDNFEDHPRTKLSAPFKDQEICSTAAGRYMILAKTWDNIAPQIGAKDFSPTNQDKAAFMLIVEQRALPLILKNNIQKAITRLNKVWATFPGAPYGQSTKDMDELIKVYDAQLALYTK